MENVDLVGRKIASPEVSLDDGKTSLSPEKICLVLSPEDVFLADGKS